MSGFPLYDNLIKDLPKKDLPVKEKENFIKSISKINNEGCELIYVLIMVFAQQHKHENINIIPYNGIIVEKLLLVLILQVKKRFYF